MELLEYSRVLRLGLEMMVAVEMAVVAMGMGTRTGTFNPQFSPTLLLKLKFTGLRSLYGCDFSPFSFPFFFVGATEMSMCHALHFLFRGFNSAIFSS